MERNQPLLDAYARYLLMPLKHDYWRWRNENNILRHLVRWQNPFTHELEGAEEQLWDKTGHIVYAKWVVRSNGPEPYRHFTKEEFIARLASDHNFARVMNYEELDPTS